MKTLQRLSAMLALAMMSLAAWADSPLTSTNFGDAYNDDVTVMKIIEQQNLDADLNTTTMAFLADEKNGVAQRLAVVNKIGWNFEGLSVGNELEKYIMKRFKAKNQKALVKKTPAGTLAVLAYAKAMSNYFNVTEAAVLAHEAVKKDNVHSFSIAMAAALIDAQIYLDSDWSMVYKVVANVVNDGSLRLDMRQQAIDLIMDYINLYEEY